MTDEMVKVLQGISLILPEEGFDEQFVISVLKRLESLSYPLKAEDSWSIVFAVQKIENSVKNACNLVFIPDELRFVAIDMICGEFLYSKKQTGRLEGFDLETAVKQIQVGDTNVTFDVEKTASPEQRLEALLSFLMRQGKDEFICFRRLKW